MNTSKKYYSHIDDSFIKEFEIHIQEVTNNMLKLYNKNTVKFKKIVNKKQLKLLISIIGTTHDFAKTFLTFQDYLNNPRKYKNKEYLKNHSFISAILAQLITKKIFKNRELARIVFLVVSNHHNSKIESINYDNLRKKLKQKTHKQWINGLDKKTKQDIEMIYNELFSKFNIKISFKDMFKELETLILSKKGKMIDDFLLDLEITSYERKKNTEEENIEYYFLLKYLYSLLVSSDVESAADLLEVDLFENISLKDVRVEPYIKHKRKENPDKFGLHKPINQTRTEHFNYVNKIAFERKKDDVKIYELIAPTGAGKTFITLELMNNINRNSSKEMQNIYCVLVTSTANQNYKVTKSVFNFNFGKEFTKNPEVMLLQDHYLSELNITKNEKTEDYADIQNSETLLSSWKSAQVNTTLVKVFETVLGLKKRYLKRFHSLSNSTITIDEVQELSPDFYKVFGKLSPYLADIFNTYIILTTATMPILFDEDVKREKVHDLSYNELFTLDHFNRVNLKIINEGKNKIKKISCKKLSNFIVKDVVDNDKNNGLVIVNSRKEAKKLYKELNNRTKLKAYEFIILEKDITSLENDNKINKILNKLDSNEKIIVISTQMIETGVDVDFEAVYRDMAPLHNLIQAFGRANRNKNKDKVDVYVFNLEKNYSIYHTKLLDITEKILLERDNIEEKDFQEMITVYFKEVDEAFVKTSNEILRHIQYFELDKINDKAILIKDNNEINFLIFNESTINDGARELFDELTNLRAQSKKGLSKKEFYENIAQRRRIRRKLLKYQVGISINQNERKKILNKLINTENLKAYPDNENSIFYYFKEEDISKWYDKTTGFKTEIVRDMCK